MPDPYTGPVLPLDDVKKPAKQPYTGEVVALPGQPDQYGVHDVGETVAADRPADARGFRPIAEDVLTRMASSLTFGTAEKAAAKLAELRGHGTYEENLIKNRAETEAAGQRLGTSGAVAADLTGGALLGSTAARLPALWRSAAPGATILGRLAPTASLPQKVLAGTAEGGAYGALSGAGHTDTGKAEDYYQNMKVGGLLGAATGGIVTGAASALPRVITPFPTTDPVRAKAMQTLADAGVDVSAGTRTGSPKLRMAEDIIAKQPLGGPNLTDRQMAQVTQNVMEKAGITGPRVAATPDVVRDGFKTVGGKINSLQKPYAVPVDDPLLNAAAKVESDVKPLVEQGQQGPLQHFIDKITSGQELSPDMAQSIRTQLNEAIKTATGQHQRGLIDLKNALDDALSRTMVEAGDDAGVVALDRARNQYAHLHILSDALNASGAAGMRGELTPSALAAALKRSVGKVGFTKGEGDLNDLARASAGYLQPPKDSMTSTREGYWNPARYALGVGGRLGINNRFAQGYLGNQALPVAPSGAQMQPAVAGATAGARPGLLQPIDQLWRGILGGP